MAICNVSLAICEFLRWAALKNALSYYSPGYVCLYKPMCLPLPHFTRGAYVLIESTNGAATHKCCGRCLSSPPQAVLLLIEVTKNNRYDHT